MEQVKNQPAVSPENILQKGMGFWASKIILTAVKFGLFTRLAEKDRMSAAEIKQALKLQCTDRHLFDFLDALTGLGMLERSGLLATALYANSRDAGWFLDKRKPSYVGGILELANNRLYRSWGELENGLLTGEAQNEITGGQEDSFTELYKVPGKLEEFVNAMNGIQAPGFTAFARKFDFSDYRTLTDAGGSGALLSILVAGHQPQISCISFDLPPVEPIAQQNIQQAGMAGRVKTASGNFFHDRIPPADLVVMGNILHDWDEERKILLMKKAFEALPANGAFVAIENIIDDERRKNVFGMMMSLNMLVQTAKGFDYTFADFNQWTKAVGFSRTELIPLAGAASAAVAYK
jgi:hypothetical protein